MADKDIEKTIEDFVNGELPEGFFVYSVRFYPEHKILNGYINYTGGRLSGKKTKIIITKIRKQFGFYLELNATGMPCKLKT